LVVWYFFPRFGILCHEKSGNPATHPQNVHTSLIIKYWRGARTEMVFLS
jgi:hypothetical protein